MTVIDYVTEEVTRQGHNVLTRDGIERVAWMLAAWRAALIWEQNGEPLDIAAIEMLGKLVEPYKNAGGFRNCDVRVGYQACPPHAEVQARMACLMKSKESMEPLDFYRALLTVHPFLDGNGRAGKIALNWLNHTLLRPIFPPADFWGYPILNP